MFNYSAKENKYIIADTLYSSIKRGAQERDAYHA